MKKNILFTLLLIIGIGLTGKSQTTPCISIGLVPPVVCPGNNLCIPIIGATTCSQVRIEIYKQASCLSGQPLLSRSGNCIIIPDTLSKGKYCARLVCVGSACSSVPRSFDVDSLDLSPPPTITIAQTSPVRPSYCPEDTLTFKVVSITGAGTGFSIQWGRRDTLLKQRQIVDSVFSITGLKNNDFFYGVVTKQSRCAIFATAYSDTVKIIVNKKPKVKIVLAPGSTGCELTVNKLIARPDSADPDSYYYWTRVTPGGIDTLSEGVNDTIFTLSPADSAKFGYQVCVEIISGRCKLKAQDCFTFKACGQVFIDPPLQNEICAGTILSVPYTIVGTFLPTNVFKVQLSDSLGNFGNPISIGTLVSNSRDTIKALIPVESKGGDCFKVRIISSLPVDTSDISSCIKVYPKPLAPATLSDSVCRSGSVTLSASSTEPSVVFKWYTSPFGGNGVFTGSSLTLNISKDTVFYVSAVSPSGCESGRADVHGIINSTLEVEAGPDLQKCVDDGLVLLSPFPINGTWTGDLPITNDEIDLSGVLPGTYKLYYEVVNTLGCSTKDSLKLVLNPKPVVAAGADTQFCSNTIPVLFNGTPAGGTWSGVGVQSDGTFVPSASGPGTFGLVYSFTLNGCTSTDTAKITVNLAPPIFTVTTLNPTACNVPDGSAMLAGIVTGSGFKVKWSVDRADSLSDPTLNNLDAGAYTVVVTDLSTSCRRIAAFGLSDPTATIPVISGLAANYCSSDTCVVIGVTPNSPTGNWSGTGVVGNKFCPALANLGANIIVYSYDTTGGCTGTATLVVRISQSPIVNAGGPVDTVCRSAVQFVLTGFLPTAPPAIWSPQPLVSSIGTVNLALAASGDNILTISRTLGTCTANDTRKIFVYDNPIVSISRNPLGPVCIGSPITLRANITNSATVVRYEWFIGNEIIPNKNLATIDVTQPGSYSVTATGLGLCKGSSAPFVATFIPLPSNGVTPSGILAPCSNAPIVLTADSLSGYSYQWFGPDSIPNAVDRRYVPTISGQYRVRIKNSSACFNTSEIVNVNILVAPVAPIISPPFRDTCLQVGQPITITIGASGAGLTFVWNRVGNPDRIIAGNSASITLDTAGRYFAKVTSSNGCFAISDTISLKQTVKISAQDTVIEKCKGDNPFVVSGLSPTTGCRLLFNGAPLLNNIFTPNQEGEFTVVYQCTNSNGCISRKNIVVKVIPLPVANLIVQGPTNVCQGDTVRLVVNDGVETGCSYQVLRNGVRFGAAVNTSIIPITQAGNYSVLVTCFRCSTASNSIQINFNPKPVVNAGDDIKACAPLKSNLNVVGITPGSWSGSPRVTSTGDYENGSFIGCDTVILTVVNPTTLCTNTDKKEICVVPLPDFNVGIRNATACLLANGSAWIIGGNNSVSYEWTKVGDATTLSISDSLKDVLPGVYQVKITSVFSNCSILRNVIINSPNNLRISIGGIQDSLCANDNPKELIGNPENGVFTSFGNRINLGSPQRFDPSISGNQIDTIFYTVNVNGCVGTGKKIVKINTIPVLDAGPNVDVCYGDTLVLRALQPSGVNLIWAGSQVENDSLYIANDIGITSSIVTFGYSVNGCSNTASKTVAVRQLPDYIVNAQDVSACGITDGKVAINILNPSQFQTIVRTIPGNAIVPAPRENLSVGIYSVLVRNNTTGCSKRETFGISGPTNINPFACLQNVPVSLCQNEATVTIGKCRPTASIYIDGIKNESLNPSVYIPDNIAVILTDTDANGCIGVEQKIVEIKEVPNVNTSGVGPLFACNSQTNVQLSGFFPAFNGSIPENGWTAPGSPSGFITRDGKINPSLIINDQPVTLLYTARNPNGCSEFKSIQFNVYSTAVASIVPNDPLVSICTGSSKTLNSQNTNANYQYTWYLGNVANPPAIGFGPRLDATLPGLYRLKLNNNGCISEFSPSILLTTTPSPIIANIGPDTTLCQGVSVFEISRPIVVGSSTSAVWSAISPTPAGFISGSGVVTPSEGVNGANLVRYIVTNGNCSDTAFRTFQINPNINAPIQVAGPNEICSGDSATLIARASGPGFSFEWTKNGIVIPNQINDSLLVTESGIYNVRVLINGNGICAIPSNQPATITVRPVPIVTISGVDTLKICYPSSTIDLNAERPFSPSDAIWSGPSAIVSSNGVITPNNIPSDGKFIITLSKTIGSCTTTKNLSITANKIPDATFLASTQAICEGDFVTFTYPNPSAYKTTWLRDNNVIVTDLDTIDIRTKGNYALVVNNNGCSASFSKDIDVQPKPNFNLVGDQSICKNGPVSQFFPISPTPGLGSWTGLGINATGTWNPQSDDVPASGPVVISYTRISEFGCRTTKSFTITVDPIPDITLVTDKDTIEIQGPAVITATGGIKFEWSPAQTLNQATGPSVLASPSESTNYTVLVTTDKGCIGTENITIIVDTELRIYDGFSPNADQKNDFWIIKNIQKYPEAKVLVYNRWGNRVYESEKGYPKPWDGKFEGNPIPIGAYFYMIDFGSNITPKSGSVTIIR